MKQRMDNESMLQWMEQKQNLLQMLIIKERENYETKST